MNKLVYIAHPISGNVKRNAVEFLLICRNIHKNIPGVIPFAPYLTALDYLADDDPAERKLGMEANEEYFKRKVMDEVWIFGKEMTDGILHEIELAAEQSIPLRFFRRE